MRRGNVLLLLNGLVLPLLAVYINYVLSNPPYLRLDYRIGIALPVSVILIPNLIWTYVHRKSGPGMHWLIRALIYTALGFMLALVYRFVIIIASFFLWPKKFWG